MRDVSDTHSKSKTRKPKVRVKPDAKPTGVFDGLKPATAPITAAQKQAKRRTDAAQRKVHKRTVVPYVPKIRNPTQQQRAAIGPAVARALRAQGITTAEQVRALPSEQRKRVNRAAGYSRTARKYRLAMTALATGESGRTVRELADKAAARAEKDTAKPGDLHKRVRLPGATVDLTPALSGIKGRLKGNPAAALVKGTGGIADVARENGIGGRAAGELIDMPANTVTGLYAVGKEAVTGHPDRAAKMIVDPIVKTVKHPVKSFKEAPVGTVLILRGVQGAAGHGAGRVMRTGALGAKAKKAASIKRAPKVVAGTRRTVERRYSGDVITKAGQVTADKAKARRRVKKGEPAEPRASARDVRQLVDEDVQAAKNITAENQARTAKRAAEAVGLEPRGPVARVKARRGSKPPRPTAASSLAAQGITTANRKDIEAYLREIRAEAKNLTGDALKRNQRTQKQIEKALAKHDPKAVDDAAAAYAKVAADLEQQVVARGLVQPHTAEATRLAGIKVRRERRRGETQRPKREAATMVRDARAEAGRADAAYTRALTDAKEAARRHKGRVPPREHDRLLAAIDRRDRAHTTLEQAQATSRQARTAHTRAFMPKGMPEPAYVSHQDLPPRAAALPTERPKVRVQAKRSGEAVRQGTLDADPAKLVEQAAGTQRLLDAAAARERFIDDYGYRPAPDKDLVTFANRKQADRHTRTTDIEAETGMRWQPFRRQDGTYTLMPSDTVRQLGEHEAAVAKVPAVKVVTTQWRRNVLAFSPRWLTGNVIEAGLRAVVAGAGPVSYTRARRTLAAMDPELRQQVRARTTGGGNYGTAVRVADTERVAGESLGRFAHAIWKLRRAPGPKQIADAYGTYTEFIFHTLNGRLESQFQTAMLGRALRDHPLMDDHVVGLSRKAAADAAKGLRNTNAQVELGRQVDRMYGRYQKFPPGLRNAVSTYTPFAAWTINAVNFLYHTLPADHPVLTGVIASANQATQEWRKQHGLYLDAFGKTEGQLPPWLQGSIPGKDASHLRVSRYTPFGLLGNTSGSPVGGLPSLLLPQLSEVLKNLEGHDWSGKPLSENQNAARNFIAAAASLIEGQIPLASQAAHVTGARLPNMRDSAQVTPGVGTRAREQFDPFRYTPAKKPVQARVKPGVTWGDQASGVTWSDKSSGITWGR